MKLSSDSASFIDTLKQELRISANVRPPTGFHHQLVPEHLNFHNKWAKPAFDQSKYTYSYTTVKNNKNIAPTPFQNDISMFQPMNSHLSKAIETEEDTKLELERIQSILETSPNTRETIPLLSSAVPFDMISYPQIPKSYLEPKFGWLTFSLGKCNLPTEHVVPAVNGFVQLIDSRSQSRLSEPVKFRIIKNEALFTQTITSSVNFQLITNNVSILCVLQHAIEGLDCYFPFALNLVPLFNEKGEFTPQTKFPSKWLHLVNGDHESAIKKLLNEENDFEKVEIDFSISTLFTPKLEREFSYSWLLTQNTNFCVSQFPPASYMPTPLILVYNLGITMKFPPNSQRVFVKMYITEEIESIRNPKALKLFSGIESGKLNEVYCSTAAEIYQKEVQFIDQVAIFVDREFKQNTHISVHVYSMDKDSHDPALIGYSVIPLFPDGTPIGFQESYKFKIYDTKKVPKDLKKAIVKSKLGNRSYLQCTVRLPPAFFPPAAVKNVIDALIPEQALPPNFKELPIDVYQLQILTMTGKLLTIIAPNTALHLMHFLDIFEGQKSRIQEILKIWTFNVMNPMLFGHNFVNDLCSAFSTVIRESANLTDDNKKVAIRELSFTLPIIFDIILVAVSTPEIKYDSKFLLEFLQLIPEVISDISNKRIGTFLAKVEGGARKSFSRGNNSNSFSASQGTPSSSQSDTSASASINESPLNSNLQSRNIDDEKSEKSASSKTQPILTSSQQIQQQIQQKQEDRMSNMMSNVKTQISQIPEAIEVNTSFANLLSCLLPILGFDKISKIIYNHIHLLTLKKKKRADRSNLSYLQFSFLLPFSYSEQFIVDLTMKCKASEDSHVSVYNPILSQVYLIIYQSFNSNEVEAIGYACKFFVNTCLSVENVPPEISRKIAFILFPLINTISSNFEGMTLKNRPKLQQSFIPIILYILKNASPSLVCRFFSDLGTSFQVHFLKFFQSIVRVVVDSLNLAKPTAKKPRIELNIFDILTQHILEFLLTIIDFLGPHFDMVVNLLSNLYNSYQPIRNVKQFFVTVSALIEKYPVERSLIAWLLSLLSFAQHDTRCLACALLMLIFKADFDHTESVVMSSIDMMDSLTAVLLAVPLRSIPMYKTLLERIIQLTKLYSKKNFEKLLKERMKAALVITKVVKDQKKSTFPPEVRCQHIMRIADQYKTYPTMRLKWLLEIVKVNCELKNFASAFIAQLHIAALVETVVEQFIKISYEKEISTKKSKSSSSDLTNNSKETTKISSNTNGLSTKYNSVNEFYLTTTQPMRNAESSLKLNAKRDFSFIPGVLCETEMKVESLAKDATALLSDFTVQLLLDSLDRAFELGKQAGLYYSLRPLYSLQLRIYQSQRNSEKMANVLESLAESVSNIQTKSMSTYDSPLSFFLVEHRKTSSDIDRQIFCVENTKVDQFLSSLNTMDRFGGLKAEYCTCHSSVNEKCKENGVCVVRLQPITSLLLQEEDTTSSSPLSSLLLSSTITKNNINNDKSDDDDDEKINYSNEFDHCYKKFKTLHVFDSNSEIDEVVELNEYTTKDYLPHYRWAADVIAVSRQNVPAIKYIQSIVERCMKLLDKVASEFEIWYPMRTTKSMPNNNSNNLRSERKFVPDEKYVVKDIRRISTVLRYIFKGNESISFQLLKLKERRPEEVKKMANALREKIVRVLAIYRRAVSEFETKQPNDQLLQLCDVMADEFVQQFQLEPIEKISFVDDFDPMDDGIDFAE